MHNTVVLQENASGNTDQTQQINILQQYSMFPEHREHYLFQPIYLKASKTVCRHHEWF